LRSSGVKVVTIVPGYIDTPLTQGNRYGMPFLMQADAFADRAYAAITAGHAYRVIPVADGRRREAAACACQSAVRSPAGRPAEKAASAPAQ
jgi:NAD(P)-dependent dehydrogenase (short-subunit alcohol dehydrogenase family)